jgi:GNAT superfamily N-acetyltransferase
MTDAPHVRLATLADLETVIAMLADDPMGLTRERNESPLPQAYVDAFEAIDRDPNHELIVADVHGRVVGVCQLSFLPNLTYTGGWRMQIEGVRVHADARHAGVGKAMMQWAIDRAQQRGCVLVQLTTDRSRPDAIRFYESMGFTASHEGMKLRLETSMPTDG